MAVRSSRFYNNPQIGQAFSNLAGMFKPPDGGDMAGYALANERRQKSKIVEMMLADPTNPNFDKWGMAVGNWTPSQSQYAVDLGDATTRRGQDTAAETARLTNAADNARALQEAKLKGEQAIVQSVIAPLNEGQTRAPGLADYFGMPGLPENTQGLVKAGQGDTVFGPNGQVLRGAEKPLTDEQVKGAVLAGMPIEQRRAAAMGQTPVEKVVGEGGAPEFVYRAEAPGRQPYIAPAAGGRLENGTALLGDGKTRWPVVQDPATGKWRHAQTGEGIPDDAQVFAMARPQGTAQEVGLGGKPTEADLQKAYTAEMSEKPTRDLLAAYDTGKTPTAGDYVALQAQRQLPDPFGLTTAATTNLMSPEGQAFYQNLRTVLPMQLLTQSGQGVTEGEYNRKLLELFPVPGEDPGVSMQKRRQLETYINAVRALSGPGRARIHPEEAKGAAPAAAPAGPAPAADGPVRVQSIEEALALPKGTPFITPDGKRKVR